MKNTSRSLSAILAALMLSTSLVACADSDSGKTNDTTTADTTPAVTTPAETQDPRLTAKDNIPDDLSFDGDTIRWICHEEGTMKFNVIGLGEETGDLVYDAVYNRTRSVEERLQLTFETDCNTGSWKDYGSLVEQNILAGDDVWDIVYIKSNSSIQMGRDYLFRPVQDLEYLDLDQPWWWTSAMEEMSLDGTVIRYLLGDLIIENLRGGMRIVYFNKRIMEDIGEDVDVFYDTVLNREWTMDEMSRLTKLGYIDVNGDGEMDTGDRFGCYIGERYMPYGMSYAHDVHRQSRDENNRVYGDYDLDRAQKSLDSILEFIYNTKGTWFATNSEPDRLVADCFASGNALFTYDTLHATFTDAFRAMDDEYGIIPSPMLDLEQKEYQCLVTNAGTYATVPTTCTDDRIGAVLEALCAESYRSVMPPFYETALKTRYSSDSKTSQCIDIIRDTAYKSILTEYDVGNCGELEFQLILKNSNAIASTYASKIEASNKKLADVYAKFESQLADN